MIKVSDLKITYQNILKTISREKKFKKKQEMIKMQINSANEKQFVEIVIPIQFKLPNFTELNQLVGVYMALVKKKVRRIRKIKSENLVIKKFISKRWLLT